MNWLRCLGASLLVVSLVFLGAAPSQACPFCGARGQTLTLATDQASFVVYGTLSDAKLSLDGDGGTTVLTIEEKVKDHKFLDGKKTITIPRYVPVDNESKVKFLIFCDLLPKDQIDPVRGLPVKAKDIVEYLQGAIKVKDQDITKKLQFFFKYLDHPDVEISVDAYNEFAVADHKDVLKFVEASERDKLAAEVAGWIRDRDTPSYRYGLYGYLLGVTGTARDAEALVELLNDPERGLVSGVDGVLAGYVSLRPKEGWEFVKRILSDPKREFTRRYAALRAVRFLWEYRPDLASHTDLLTGLDFLMDQSDIADLAIEDLRKWKQWSLSDRILDLDARESHNVPIIKRAILRYALSCPPENKRAAAFVAERRQRDPDRVKDVEELLRAETGSLPGK